MNFSRGTSRNLLPITALGLSLILSPIVQAQALTNDQLSLQVTNAEKSLDNLERKVQKLYRIINNLGLLDLFKIIVVLPDKNRSLSGWRHEQTNDLS